MNYIRLFQLVAIVLCFGVNANDSLNLQNKKILISYVAYAPQSVSLTKYDQCKSNFDFFLRVGVTQSENIDYIFSLVDDTAVPKRLNMLTSASNTNNIIIQRVDNMQLDLYTHGSVLRNHTSDPYDYYVFMNCGSRGPYYKSPTSHQPGRPTQAHGIHNYIQANSTWLQPYISKMQSTVGLVGSTLSCEVSPHVQSYIMVARADAAKIIMDVWSPDERVSSDSRAAAIVDTEVAVSTAVLQAGIGISCLDSRYLDIDGTYNRTCTSQYGKRDIAYDLNPAVCRGVSSEGCTRPVDPCEAVVVKYGGEMIATHFVSPILTAMLKKEESLLP